MDISEIKLTETFDDIQYVFFCLQSDVWIAMELMNTCLDKLMKRLKQPIPEKILGKVSCAVSNCFLKIIHFSLTENK